MAFRSRPCGCEPASSMGFTAPTANMSVSWKVIFNIVFINIASARSRGTFEEKRRRPCSFGTHIGGDETDRFAPGFLLFVREKPEPISFLSFFSFCFAVFHQPMLRVILLPWPGCLFRFFEAFCDPLDPTRQSKPFAAKGQPMMFVFLFFKNFVDVRCREFRFSQS